MYDNYSINILNYKLMLMPAVGFVGGGIWETKGKSKVMEWDRERKKGVRTLQRCELGIGNLSTWSDDMELYLLASNRKGIIEG